MNSQAQPQRATGRAKRHITSKHIGVAKKVRSPLVPFTPRTSAHTNNLGYLFFTSVGILFGFKKPLAFFDFAAITSISYTAVLRNTFNLVISTPTGDMEFGMLDQPDFAGINDYVQKHGLQDASLAADRRAKKLNVNKVGAKKDIVNGAEAEGVAEEEESELQKAERELQDQEDDEDEDDDFDPGSEGESEGSGSDSDDEHGQEYEEGDTAEVEYDEAHEDEMQQ